MWYTMTVDSMEYWKIAEYYLYTTVCFTWNTISYVFRRTHLLFASALVSTFVLNAWQHMLTKEWKEGAIDLTLACI